MNETASRRLLNLGCGPRARRTVWQDCDGSWNLRWQRSIPGRIWHGLLGMPAVERWPQHVRHVELTTRLPFDDGSIDAVYASHVLEHLHHDEGMSLLSECRRVLRRESGVIRLVLPDTRRIVSDYLSSDSKDAAESLNRELMFRPRSRSRGLRRLYEALADFHSHKFMYDEKYTIAMLHAAGFREAVARRYGESLIQEIEDVEDPGRVLDGAGFVVEAQA